jgi:hypothetical protein
VPTDEELVELARTYPAFRHHLRNPLAPFLTPAPDRDVTPILPEPTEDDRPLVEKFPALKAHRGPEAAEIAEAARAGTNEEE